MYEGTAEECIGTFKVTEFFFKYLVVKDYTSSVALEWDGRASKSSVPEVAFNFVSLVIVR